MTADLDAIAVLADLERSRGSDVATQGDLSDYFSDHRTYDANRDILNPGDGYDSDWGGFGSWGSFGDGRGYGDHDGDGCGDGCDGEDNGDSFNGWDIEGDIWTERFTQ